jgi:heme/copper-type cytochrome/quinol oxidase subunit 2
MKNLLQIPTDHITDIKNISTVEELKSYFIIILILVVIALSYFIVTLIRERNKMDDKIAGIMEKNVALNTELRITITNIWEKIKG